jgi:hypothetical protein
LNANSVANINASLRRSNSSGLSDTGTPVANASRRSTTASAPGAADSRAGIPSPGNSSRPAAQNASSARSGYTPKPSRSLGVVPVKPTPASRQTILISAVAIAVLLTGGGLLFALSAQRPPSPARDPDTPPLTPSSQPAAVVLPEQVIPRATDPGAASTTQASSIATIHLQGPTVVYILDRNGCTAETFQRIVQTCLRSVESLSSSRLFQVIVWNGQQDLIFPATPGLATQANIAACRTAMADVYPGSGDPGLLMEKALAGNPNELVILSAVDLDELQAAAIRKAIEGKSLLLHGLAIGNDLTGEQLRPLVIATKGQFEKIDLADLK